MIGAWPLCRADAPRLRRLERDAERCARGVLVEDPHRIDRARWMIFVLLCGLRGARLTDCDDELGSSRFTDDSPPSSLAQEVGMRDLLDELRHDDDTPLVEWIDERIELLHIVGRITPPQTDSAARIHDRLLPTICALSEIAANAPLTA